jgi:hypothetical protein
MHNAAFKTRDWNNRTSQLKVTRRCRVLMHVRYSEAKWKRHLFAIEPRPRSFNPGFESRIELTANSVKQLDDVTDLSEPFGEVLLVQGDVFPSYRRSCRTEEGNNRLIRLR